MLSDHHRGYCSQGCFGSICLSFTATESLPCMREYIVFALQIRVTRHNI